MDVITQWIKVLAGLNNYLLFSVAALLSIIIYWITKKVTLNLFSKFAEKSQTNLDDLVLKNKVLQKVLWALPAMLAYNAAYLVPEIQIVIQKICMIIFVSAFIFGFNSLLNTLNEYFGSLERFKGRPLKGFFEVVKIAAYIIGGFIIIGLLTDQSPLTLLSGIGALTAVIMLIFRDTILSFVASLQISSNSLVKVGDWITVPQFGADGDVLDIALHTVKIQNWDKTITVIPTHKLLDVTFKNWRGMIQSGGRRIKRAIHIDLNSVKFCDKEMIDSFEKIHLLKDYIKGKKQIYEATINDKKITNVGTFRKYIELYIKHHNKIHTGLTSMVRQLPPGPQGLPIEIYTFTNTTNWGEYENIQGDIFDHLIAITSDFDLKIFQDPSGSDFAQLNIKK